LVLIDEFGKGTQWRDGAGLMAALVHGFAERGTEAPLVLATTHYHEVLECWPLDRH
jgi:DNA mismatch repair protein MSH5